MSNQLVPGCNVHIEIDWIWDVPQPNPVFGSHAHSYDEIILNIGLDPDNPGGLGAESEL